MKNFEDTMNQVGLKPIFIDENTDFSKLPRLNHNTDEQNAAFREAWDATNARWKAEVEADRVEQIEHYAYLDELRLSGVTNMWEASPYLREEFNLTKARAGEVLSAWMKQFGKEP